MEDLHTAISTHAYHFASPSVSIGVNLVAMASILAMASITASILIAMAYTTCWDTVVVTVVVSASLCQRRQLFAAGPSVLYSMPSPRERVATFLLEGKLQNIPKSKA